MTDVMDELRSGVRAPISAIRRWSRKIASVSTSHAPTLVDLFAGCGGMTRGFVDAGFRPVFAVDFDPASAATYAANFPTAKVVAGDIADVPDDQVPKARVVIGGPPCQGFSGLGKRDPEDHRNGLWKEY